MKPTCTLGFGAGVGAKEAATGLVAAVALRWKGQPAAAASLAVASAFLFLAAAARSSAMRAAALAAEAWGHISMVAPGGGKMPFSLCNLSTSAFAAMLAYPATISLDLRLSAGPMIGHLVARSVRTEREEKRGEDALDKERRVAVLVLPKKGQAFLKRAILSMMVEMRKEKVRSMYIHTIIKVT